jgi:two-component system sensor histidine kinase AlgZ
LYAGARMLRRVPYWAGCALVLVLALALAAATHAALGAAAGTGIGRALAFAAVSAALALAYLTLHLRAHSPALAEARLQALQARIRPHFLFNSLNAVLALIRSDPRRAERTLEDLADLFRALMSDGRSLVRLADEIALIERYAAIEQLRLGERLRMSWDMDQAPVDALLPPLVLQPLLENAIYHGVEPGTGIGDVLVRIGRHGNRVQALIENPSPEGGAGARAGNHMALDNIRERLMLFFDADARLETKIVDGRYRVEIDMPYRAGRA